MLLGRSDDEVIHKEGKSDGRGAGTGIHFLDIFPPFPSPNTSSSTTHISAPITTQRVHHDKRRRLTTTKATSPLYMYTNPSIHVQGIDNTQSSEAELQCQYPSFHFTSSYNTIPTTVPATQDCSFMYRGQGPVQIQNGVGGGAQGSYNLEQNSISSSSSSSRKSFGHARNLSESTINSTGPSSPYLQSFSNPYIVNSDLSPALSSRYDDASTVFQTTPQQEQCHNQQQFAVDASTAGYMPSQLSHTPAAHLAMKDMAIDHHNSQPDDMPDFSHSSRHSISSRGQDSPSTPQMGGTEEGETESRPSLFKVPTTGETAGTMTDEEFVDFCLYMDGAEYKQTAPKVELFRTESAACADELYNPENFTAAATAQPTPPRQPKPNLLTPHRNLVNERLLSAASARSSSPHSLSGDRSPFRPGSPLAPPKGYAKQEPFKSATTTTFLRNSADSRRQAREEASQKELLRHEMPKLRREATKTMSPRDALLDYNEVDAAADMPLFPEAIPEGYKQHFGGTEAFLDNYINASGQLFPDAIAGTQQQQQQPQQQQQQQQQRRSHNIAGFRASDGSTINVGSTSDANAFNFMPPTTSQPQAQVAVAPAPLANDPFSGPHYRTFNPSIEQTAPEFPAHLTSMDSSHSEAPASSQGSNVMSTYMPQRPANTSADRGTYTCTAPHCTQRFETSVKLQQHKRDAHPESSHTHTPRESSLSAAPTSSVGTSPARATSYSGSASASGSTSGSPELDEHGEPLGSGMTSAALAARNSQTGPHKCTRINPSTGKPCNSIFSRPYDLTRHEDTIHNRQKVKVRCGYCREEKSFSRNDALTRHMRVVHPEVPWEGRRRRGEHF